MKTKFTEGPWDVGTSKNISTGIVSHTINKMQPGLRPLTQGISDAHLIAAAPDMYLALTQVRQGYLNLIEFNLISESHHKDLYKSFSEIDALLAKARGESNE